MKQSRLRVQVLLSLLLPVLLASCLSSGSLADQAFESQSQSSGDDSGGMEDEEESPDIYLDSHEDGAEVYLIEENGALTYLGTTPLWFTPESDFGTYRFLFRRDNYQDAEKSISLPAFFDPEVHVRMQPLTGTLHIRVTEVPENYWIQNQYGHSFTAGNQPVITGENRLEFRALGYKTQTFTLDVRENEEYALTIEPEEAAFSARYTAGELILDPSPLSPLRFSFFSSHGGEWIMTLKTEDGEIVHEIDRGRISHFETTAEWDGKDREGEMIRDGAYLLETLINSSAGESRTLVQHVQMQDRINTPLTHSLHGSPGSLYADTAPTGSQGITWTGGVFAHMASYSFTTLTAGLAWVPVNTTELGMNLFALTLDRTPYDDTPEDAEMFPGISGYVKQQVFSSPFLTLSGQIKGTLSPSVVIDQATNMQGVSVSLIPTLQYHPFSLTLQPQLMLSDRYARYDADDSAPASGLYSWMYLRYALSWNPEIFLLTLSGTLRTRPLDEGFALQSLADTGVEIAFGNREVSLQLLGGVQYGSSGFYTSGGLFMSLKHSTLNDTAYSY